MFLLPTPNFGWFFVFAVDLLDLRRGTSACIGAWTLRRFLGAVATKVSLFFASKALACFHKLRSFFGINSSCPRVSRRGVHGVGVVALLVIPSCLPLFWHLRLFAWFRGGVSCFQA